MNDLTPRYETQVFETPIGNAVSLRNSETGASARLIRNTEVETSIPQFAKLNSSIETKLQQIGEIAGKTLPHAVDAEIAKVDLKPIQQNYLGAVLATVKETESVQRDQMAADRAPADIHGTANLIHFEFLKRETVAEKVKFAAQLDDFSAALLARMPRALTGFSDDQYEELIMSRVRAHNLRVALKDADTNSNFAMTPTAKNPIASGIDPVKLERMVQIEQKILEKRREAIDAATENLKQVIHLHAVLNGVSPEDAHAMLIGKVEK